MTSIKNRVQKIEDRFPKEKLQYKMSPQQIEHQRRIFGWSFGKDRLSEDHIYENFRDTQIDIILKYAERTFDRKKLCEEFNRFFFEILAKEERADLILEVLFKDMLPDNYEFKIMSKYLDFIKQLLI